MPGAGAGTDADAPGATPPVKRLRHSGSPAASSVDHAADGQGVDGSDRATIPATRADYDPVAWECPCGGCEYDCQKRAPVRAACTCKRLLCRKCAGVVASLPDAAPCDLCGAAAVGPFEASDFQRDVGVVQALLSRLQQAER